MRRQAAARPTRQSSCRAIGPPWHAILNANPKRETRNPKETLNNHEERPKLCPLVFFPWITIFSQISDFGFQISDS